MRSWIKNNLKTIITTTFIIPILLVAFVSVSHVTIFYELSNPITWAIYLSLAIEIAALSALAAVSVKLGNFVYVPFGIVTLIQFVGNIFFSYSYINEASQYFIDWVSLVGPIIEPMGIDSDDIIGHKRFLSIISGGLLPLISLTFIHMLVKYTNENKTGSTNEPIPVKEIDIDELSKLAGKQEVLDNDLAYKPTPDDLERLDKILTKAKPVEQVVEQPNIEVTIEPVQPIEVIEPVQPEPPQTDNPEGKRIVYSKE
jgi:hypothetical protein